MRSLYGKCAQRERVRQRDNEATRQREWGIGAVRGRCSGDERQRETKTTIEIETQHPSGAPESE